MNDPTPIGDSARLKELQARLAAKGIHPYEGDLPAGETPEEAAERIDRQRAAVAARWTNRLPALYAQAKVSDLDDPTRAQVQRWIDQDWALNLILAGPVGTGKTHAAYAVGNWAAANRLHAEAWTLVDLLEAMRPEGDRDAAAYVKRADVLVLDDVGAAKVSEWAVEQVVSLMDTRLRSERRTIVTTNLTEPQVTETYGARFMDRLRHRSSVVVLSGASRRQPAW